MRVDRLGPEVRRNTSRSPQEAQVIGRAVTGSPFS
jgi:hypothetical protein